MADNVSTKHRPEIYVRIILFVFMPVTLLLANGCSQLSINDTVVQSLNLAQTGDQDSWERALKNIESCIKRGVKNENLISFYVLCLTRTGRDEEALKIALEQVSANMNNFLCNYQIGKLYFNQGKYLDAYPYLQKCNELKPEQVNSMILLLKTAAKLNMPEEKELYLQLLEHSSFRESFLVYNDLACWYAAHADVPQALSYFSRALKYSDGHSLVFLNMAILNDLNLNNDKVAQRYYLNFLYKSKDNYPEKSKKVLARLQKIGKKRE